jgi:hypothetical protein
MYTAKVDPMLTTPGYSALSLPFNPLVDCLLLACSILLSIGIGLLQKIPNKRQILYCNSDRGADS